MIRDEIEIVARASYEQGTGRSDWDAEIGGINGTRDYWRGIARAAIDALDRHRQEKADDEHAQQARMLSELGDLAHNGEGA